MTNLSLVLHPHYVLKTYSKEVSFPDETLPHLFSEMKRIMIENQGIGIAANQVGILKRAILVMDVPSSKLIPMVNPVVTSFYEYSRRSEGCLSFPNENVVVDRYMKVMVEYFDVEGNKCKLKAKDLTAACILHEIDHINGIVFTEKNKGYKFR